MNSDTLIAVHGQFSFYETDHETIRIALPRQHWVTVAEMREAEEIAEFLSLEAWGTA